MLSSLYEEFEKLVQSQFITPKQINTDKKNMAYLNMNKKMYSQEEIEKKIEKKNKNKNKEKNEDVKETTSEYYDKYTDEYGITYNIPKNVKFGMHANDSFFEVYARENVYQLFDYSMMKYMKYEITLPEDEKHEVKIEDKKDNYKLEEMDKNNLQYTVARNDEDNNNNIEQKDLININTNQSEILTNLNKAIKNPNVSSNKKTKKNKKIKNINNNLNNLNSFKGDFDFILPGLKVDKLKKVLESKDLSPFLFYGRIDINNSNEFDIIGEIKENFHNSLYNYEQLIKYFKMIELFKKKHNDSIQFERFGFKASRTKILMYVFDTSYSWFLKNMLDFRINQTKFVEADNNFKNEDTFNKICNSFKNDVIKGNDDKKKNFIKLIIESNYPFIFLYIPDVITTNIIKFTEIEKLKGNTYKLTNKYNDVSSELNKVTNKYNDVSSELNKITNKYNEMERELNKVTNKYNEVTNEYNKVTNKYNKVTNEYNKVTNELIDVKQELNELKRRMNYMEKSKEIEIKDSQDIKITNENKNIAIYKKKKRNISLFFKNKIDSNTKSTSLRKNQMKISKEQRDLGIPPIKSNKDVNKLNKNNNGMGNKISSIEHIKEQFIYQRKFIKK